MRVIEQVRLKWYRILQMMLMITFIHAIQIQGYTQDFSVYTVQNMSFGAFFLGNSGGTIEIGADGTRTVSGDVVPIYLGIPFYQATFEIEAPPGTIISILNNAEVKLPGSNGGMLTWTIGNTSPMSPFITTVPAPGKTQVHIGGKLTASGVGVNPAGAYAGNIMITFNQE